MNFLRVCENTIKIILDLEGLNLIFLFITLDFSEKKYYLDKVTPDKKLLRKVTVCKKSNLAKTPNLIFKNV